MVIVAIDLQEPDGLDATGHIRTHLPFMSTDPAYVHVVMLMAATHYAQAREQELHTIDLLQLKGMAIREINTAIAEDSRGTSDQIIAAVANMASYEAFFGSPAICNTHMQGLSVMVSLRGGLSALGHDGVLGHLILWISSVTSQITGNRTS
jgi:hypothetical protein